ncbi:uncharacterized protein LOC142765972 [Rhipicephalus microplus]|uniref:uncharacterized protein LOC142765972 n=1 Tax=Rhipicephalus microplus TaxID=6941 RepID=UPI003F6D8B89
MWTNFPFFALCFTGLWLGMLVQKSTCPNGRGAPFQGPPFRRPLIETVVIGGTTSPTRRSPIPGPSRSPTRGRPIPGPSRPGSPLGGGGIRISPVPGPPTLSSVVFGQPPRPPTPTPETIVAGPSQPPDRVRLDGDVSKRMKLFNHKLELFLTASDASEKPRIGATKVAQLLSVAGDEALEVFNYFNFTEGESKNDFETVVKKFEDELDYNQQQRATGPSLPNVFQRTGCIQREYQMVLQEVATPSVQTPRRVPLALQKRLKEELERMLKAGILTKVEEPTDRPRSPLAPGGPRISPPSTPPSLSSVVFGRPPRTPASASEPSVAALNQPLHPALAALVPRPGQPGSAQKPGTIRPGPTQKWLATAFHGGLIPVERASL